MVYFIIYIPLCLMIAYAGSDRKIGFGMSFLVSFLLTPIIGFIVTILSPNKAQSEYYENLVRKEKENTLNTEYSNITNKSAELE